MGLQLIRQKALLAKQAQHHTTIPGPSPRPGHPSPGPAEGDIRTAKIANYRDINVHCQRGTVTELKAVAGITVRVVAHGVAVAAYCSNGITIEFSF